MKILKSEKYKLIKHLGNLSLSLEDLFNIDGLTFDRLQYNTNNIKNLNSNENNVPENDIENIISVVIYFRKQEDNFTQTEINNKVIDLSNMEARKFSFLEFNKLFEVTKRFKLLEIKNKAYSIFSVTNHSNFIYNQGGHEDLFKEYNNYVLLDINMKWWAFNLVLFDEIERKNLEKGFILNNSKFFQINPLINVKILILIKFFSSIIYSLWVPSKYIYLKLIKLVGSI